MADMMSADEFLDRVKSIQKNPNTSWVLFKNGTIVFFREPPDNLEEDAKKLLSTEGFVQAGGKHGDFQVYRLSSGDWFIGCWHPDIATYICQEDIKPKEDTSDAPEGFDYETGVGLIGRGKRALDSQSLEVIHSYMRP